MKISRKSWHYRWLARFYMADAPKDLCTYFWKLVGSFAILLLLACAVTAGTVFVGVLLYEHIKGVSLGAAAIGIAAGVSAAVAKTCRVVDKAFRSDNPNIAVAYVKAKKREHCPLIELED